MGYGPDSFASSVANWLELKWLPASGRIIEFGAQEFYCDQDEARSCTAKFLKSRGIDDAAIRAALPPDKPVSVAQVYRTLGIDYTSIDVDGAHGSILFDLNTFAPPRSWRAAFDFVNNEGTIEHLVNPTNGFQVAHELLKVGGVAMHSIPLTGWRDHGLVYPTIKFYAYLIGANRYEILQSDIGIDQSALDFVDRRFVLRDPIGQPLLDVGAMKLTDAWLKLAVRKTSAAEFRAPYDHLLVEHPGQLGAKLRNNFSAYSRTRFTANGVLDRAGDELGRAGTPFQRVATILAIAAIIVLNGGGLLFGMARPLPPITVCAFSAGVLGGILPSIIAWVKCQSRGGVAGTLLRYGTGLIWAAAALAFVVGAAGAVLNG